MLSPNDYLIALDKTDRIRLMELAVSVSRKNHLEIYRKMVALITEGKKEEINQ